MTPRLYAELILLAAIWGGSFILTRVLAPNIGALVTAEVRLLLGVIGVALITRAGPVPLNQSTLLAIAACIGATVCSGLAGCALVLCGLTLLFMPAKSTPAPRPAD